MSRFLVVASVVASVLVGGAAVVIFAKVIFGSWLWGSVAVVAFVFMYLAVGLAATRRAKQNPERAQAFLSSWGRAMAAGSGGWEPRRGGRADDGSPDA